MEETDWKSLWLDLRYCYCSIFKKIFLRKPLDNADDCYLNLESSAYVTFCIFSQRVKGLKNLMSMCKDFTWSDLPERDPNTGSYTISGLIPRIQRFSWRGSNTVLVLHSLYLALRIITGNKNKLFFNCWVPFDITYLPNHITVLIIQVILWNFET